MNQPTIRQTKIATEIVSSILASLNARKGFDTRMLREDIQTEIFEDFKTIVIQHMQRSEAEELSLEQEEALQVLYKTYGDLHDFEGAVLPETFGEILQRTDTAFMNAMKVLEPERHEGLMLEIAKVNND